MARCECSSEICHWWKTSWPYCRHPAVDEALSRLSIRSGLPRPSQCSHCRCQCRPQKIVMRTTLLRLARLSTTHRKRLEHDNEYPDAFDLPRSGPNARSHIKVTNEWYVGGNETYYVGSFKDFTSDDYISTPHVNACGCKACSEIPTCTCKVSRRKSPPVTCLFHSYHMSY